jgi:hypothetical protein
MCSALCRSRARACLLLGCIFEPFCKSVRATLVVW